VRAERADPRLRTPETYLGAARAQGWVNSPTGTLRAGSRDFGPPAGKPPRNGFAYSGTWEVGDDRATAGTGAGIDLTFTGRRVFLVLGSPGEERSVTVRLDGEPIAARDAGADVEDGTAVVGSQRLYGLVDLPRAGTHTLSLRFDPGIEGYAFTFG
jgi:hypothetical protein